MAFQNEVRTALADIKEQLVQTRISTEKNTYVLNEHHVRSSNLEARFKPVERHVLVFNGIAKVTAFILTVGAAVVGILHYLK